MGEYEAASKHLIAELGFDAEPPEAESDSRWSVEEAEKRLFKRLDAERKPSKVEVTRDQQSAYRPTHFRWPKVGMSLAAVVLLSMALAAIAYRSGLKRATDVARSLPQPVQESDSSLEEQASDAGYERAQLLSKLNDDAKAIEDLKHELRRQIGVVNSLKSARSAVRTPARDEQVSSGTSQSSRNRDQELATAQTRLAELQKTVEDATAQRDEKARQAASLEAKVDELAALLRQREQALDRSESEAAEKQELLDHDRDIRELMGARDLYIADVHDVSGRGTEKTYGRVFYTRGKRLIFYAFDLDAQPGLRNATSFQAWGQRGPNKEQARSLGIFYEDNASRKRWVLKADDPQKLEDIDEVFVTVEPNGGSARPSGKRLLFTYLRADPNYP
jgi:hypothetical protein